MYKAFTASVTFFFSSRRRHTRCARDWSSDVCSSDLVTEAGELWEISKLDVVEIPTNRPIARHDREDKIYKTKREKYNAVIEEVVALSNAGRPVLIGTTSVEISELLSKIGRASCRERV